MPKNSLNTGLCSKWLGLSWIVTKIQSCDFLWDTGLIKILLRTSCYIWKIAINRITGIPGSVSLSCAVPAFWLHPALDASVEEAQTFSMKNSKTSSSLLPPFISFSLRLFAWFNSVQDTSRQRTDHSSTATWNVWHIICLPASMKHLLKSASTLKGRDGFTLILNYLIILRWAFYMEKHYTDKISLQGTWLQIKPRK